MSELGRVLRLDARRAALLIVPVLAVAGAVAALHALVPGEASWDGTSVALAAAVRLLGPLATGLAGWVAVREQRLAYLRDISARSPATGPLVDLLLIGGTALVAYGAVVVVLAAVAGPPRPLAVLAGGAALAPHMVLGYLAGRLAPAAVLAATAAAGLWAALRAPGSSWWSLLPPAAIGPVEPFAALRAGVLADQALCAAAGAAALLLGYLCAVTRRRAALAVPLAAALACTAAGAAGLRSAGGAAGPVPVTLSCRPWPLAVCVHPALESALPALEAAMTPLAARLSGTPGAFTRVEQRPAGQPAAVRGGVALVHVPDLSPGYELRAMREIRDALGGPRACRTRAPATGSPATGSAAASYNGVVDAWLLAGELAGAGLPGGDPGAGPPVSADPLAAAPAAANLFAGWAEQSRRDWLRAHFERYRRCALTAADFR